MMSVAGFSKTRLGQLHEVLAGHVERGEAPGLVTAVYRRGETYLDAIGATGFGGRPVQADTIFRISSMSKAITATAALILLEECRLALDEPVDQLLPELANRRVLIRPDSEVGNTIAARRPITLRDLLAFTMGFGIIFAPPGTYPIQNALDQLDLGQGPPEPAGVPAPDEWMRRLGTLPLLAQPGEAWHYNTASDVLGVLIARASGQDLDVFLRERVFEPLGMKDTGFWVAPEDTGRFATAYRPDRATGELVAWDSPMDGQWNTSPAFQGGGGGLVSTTVDYLAFARMLLDLGRCGGGRLLARPTVLAMTADQLLPAQKAVSVFTPGFFDSVGWGYGMAVTTRRDGPSSTVGAYGWNGGHGTSWFSDPAEDLIGVVMTQRAFTSPVPPAICRDFKTLVYQAIDD